MKSQKLTINHVLDRDKLMEFAEFIASDKAEDLIIFYVDKETDSIKWKSTMEDWRLIIGQAEIMHKEILRDYEEDINDGG